MKSNDAGKAVQTGTVPVVTIEDEGSEVVSPCGAKSGGSNALGSSDVEVLDRGSTATYDYVVVDTASLLPRGKSLDAVHERHMNVNFHGPRRLMEALLPDMVHHRPLAITTRVPPSTPRSTSSG